MKKDIHPKYSAAVIKCACGKQYLTGSTMPEMTVEICAACHPFYTGQTKLVDTRGRVEKFRARVEKARKAPAKKA
jgi:large subunit ribosomal protein L31